MIRPVNFAFNPETAESNAFQVRQTDADVQKRAVNEFDALVKALTENGVDVMVIEDTPEPHTPDSIFPNNWISFHEDGNLVLYPMYATKRRKERKQHVFNLIQEKFSITKTTDLTYFEKDNHFLEGTGSMVLDREHKIAYACLANRTSEKALEVFCKETGYTPVVFNSVDEKGQPIYHTNVMMCVADKYVVICLDSLPDLDERKMVEQKILSSGKEIITISFNQLNHFAGNMLQLENIKGEKLLVMSSQACHSLSTGQIHQLSAYNKIIHTSINTIETNGGGSARCMIAEIHLPVK